MYHPNCKEMTPTKCDPNEWKFTPDLKSWETAHNFSISCGMEFFYVFTEFLVVNIEVLEYYLRVTAPLFYFFIVLKDTSNLIIATATSPTVETPTEVLEPNAISEDTKDGKNSDKIFECTAIYV